MNKILLLAITLAVAIGATIYAFTQHPVAALPPTEPASVSSDTIHYPQGAPQLAYLQIEAAHTAALPLFAPVTARLIYDEDHTYRAITPVNGRVMEIYAGPGDHVRQGQALALIDSPDYGTALAENKKAQTDLRAKRAASQRAKLLYEAGVMARKDFESAEADLGMAEAEARRTEDHLLSLGPAAGRSFVLRSRIDGVVAERAINPGQEVRNDATTPLFVITNPTRLWLSVDVAERDIGLVHRGETLDVQLDVYPGEHLKATVTNIGVSLDAATRRLPVVAVIDNRDGRLHPEMFARVYPVDEKQKPLIVLPNTALFTKGLYSYIWVETSPGTLQRRRVTVVTQLPDRSYVADGVNDGERVVTAGALLLEADTTTG